MQNPQKYGMHMQKLKYTIKGGQPVKKKIAYIGIDYHMETVSAAVIIEDEKDFFDTIRMKNNDKVILKYLKKISKEFDLCG